MSLQAVEDKALLAKAARTTDINYDEEEQLLLQAEQQLLEEGGETLVTKEVSDEWA